MILIYDLFNFKVKPLSHKHCKDKRFFQFPQFF